MANPSTISLLTGTNVAPTSLETFISGEKSVVSPTNNASLLTGTNTAPSQLLSLVNSGNASAQGVNVANALATSNTARVAAGVQPSPNIINSLLGPTPSSNPATSLVGNAGGNIDPASYTTSSPFAGSQYTPESQSKEMGQVLASQNSQNAKNTTGQIKSGSLGTQSKNQQYPEYTRSKNKLDDYREYSYQTMLFMASDEEAAQYIDTYLANQNNITGLGGERQVQTSPGGGYFVQLTNSLTMSDIYLTSIDLESRITMVDGANALSGFGTSVELKIEEPLGCYLLEIMTELGLQMGVSVVTATYYVLKIIFVGYTDTNTVEYITDIPVIKMISANMSLTFDQTGTAYTWDLIPVSGLNEDSVPETTNIANGLHINTSINGKAGTLSQVMDKLASKLNSVSSQYYKCMTSQLTKQGCKTQPAKVEYKINVASEYAKLLVTQSNLNNKDEGTCDEGPIINAGENSTISKIIGAILHDCPDILALKKNFPALVISHKLIKSGSTPTYEITYTITNSKTPGAIKIPNPPTPVDASSSSSTSTESTSMNSLTIKPNFVFDYDYTGKNVDILKYEMMVDNSMTQFFITATNFATNVSSNGNGPTTVAGVRTNSQFICPPPNSVLPLFAGSMSSMKHHTHFPDPAQAMAYNMAMSEFISLSQTIASATIRGNPEFLTTSLKAYGVQLTNDTGTLVTAQINVKMPRYKLNNLGNNVAAEQRKKSFARRFWYQGVYMIRTVRSIFADGQFTQEISLGALPSMTQKSLGTTSNTTPENVGVDSSNCLGTNPNATGNCGGGSGFNPDLTIQPGIPTASQKAFKAQLTTLIKNSPQAQQFLAKGMSPVDPIGQIANETGNGTSPLWLNENNPAGLSGNASVVAQLNAQGIPCELAESQPSGNSTYIAFPTAQDGINAMFSSVYVGADRYQSQLQSNGYYSSSATPTDKAALYAQGMANGGWARSPVYSPAVRASILTYLKA